MKRPKQLQFKFSVSGRSRRGAWVYGICVLVGVFIGSLLMVERFMASQCSDRLSPARIEVRADGIHFDGAITTESVAELLSKIDSWDKGVPNVWLQSGGGLVNEALYFALMTSERNIKTSVGRNGYCASACVILFLAGAEHFADETAAFGLHGAYCRETLSALDCLLHKDYEKAMEQYKAYMKMRAPKWHEYAVADGAYSYPPDKVLCYTIHNNDTREVSSENDNHISRAACALNPRLREYMTKPLSKAECQSGPIAMLEAFFKHLPGMLKEGLLTALR